jgi:hypothetical protein
MIVFGLGASERIRENRVLLILFAKTASAVEFEPKQPPQNREEF